MKGDPQVMAGLQQAITAEITLANMYSLYRDDAQRFGLAIAAGWDALHEQSEKFASDLAGRLLFLEGAPRLMPAPTETANDIAAALANAVAAELAILALYTDLCTQALEQKDLDNFHYYQHQVKWHRQGGQYKEGKEIKGHISWLQKELWQLKNVGGESAFIAEQI